MYKSPTVSPSRCYHTISECSILTHTLSSKLKGGVSAHAPLSNNGKRQMPALQQAHRRLHKYTVFVHLYITQYQIRRHWTPRKGRKAGGSWIMESILRKRPEKRRAHAQLSAGQIVAGKAGRQANRQACPCIASVGKGGLRHTFAAVRIR